jgi:hypothetical protein
LRYAVSYGKANCVRLLIDAGADMEAKDRVRVPHWSLPCTRAMLSLFVFFLFILVFRFRRFFFHLFYSYFL